MSSRASRPRSEPDPLDERPCPLAEPGARPVRARGRALRRGRGGSTTLALRPGDELRVIDPEGGSAGDWCWGMVLPSRCSGAGPLPGRSRRAGAKTPTVVTVRSPDRPMDPGDSDPPSALGLVVIRGRTVGHGRRSRAAAAGAAGAADDPRPARRSGDRAGLRGSGRAMDPDHRRRGSPVLGSLGVQRPPAAGRRGAGYRPHDHAHVAGRALPRSRSVVEVLRPRHAAAAGGGPRHRRPA